jgi:cytochrome c oxidase cbb3-type subunit III
MRAAISVVFVALVSALASGALPRTLCSQTLGSAPPDLAAAKVIFESRCALCHGIDGGGRRGPSLRRTKLVHATDDEALRSVIENGIPPEMPEAWYLTKSEVASVAAFVRSLGNVPPETLPGDAARGKAVYAHSGCSACHILNGEGVGYGPELTEVGARRSSVRLRETLENPANTIPANLLFIEVLTNAGQRIRGIRLNEDTFTMQLKDQQGRFFSFRKSELRDLKQLRGETPMPAYSSVLSAPDLDDLISFLASLRAQP